MSAPSLMTRRAALRILSLTAASWHLVPARAAAPTPTALPELRIGFQKGSVNLVLLKRQGGLDTRLPATRVQWIEFPAGPQLLEALAVGSIDFGATGDSPPVFAQAAGKALHYVGAEPSKPDSSAILVKPDSPLRSVADLKGRRIALQKGSSAHFLVLQAVTRAGLAWQDIDPVYLPPSDARAAFERGAVDAWAIWDPYYAAVEVSSTVRVLSTSRGLTGNNSFYLASRRLVEHPAALQTLFAALTEADAFVQANRTQAARLYSELSGLELPAVERMLARRPASPVGPLTPALLDEQQRVADAFTQLGLIPRPIRIADTVWSPSRAIASRS